MNILRIITMYMALMYTTAIQASPDVVPPTVAPTTTSSTISIVSQNSVSPTPSSTPEPIYSPSPSPLPIPDITPNRSYKQIKLWDSGTKISTMQEKLLELGYYQGNVDGKFGYQTLDAVKLFQTMHSLDVDGIAGKQTLTILYETDELLKLETPVPSINILATPEIVDTTVIPISWDSDNIEKELPTFKPIPTPQPLSIDFSTNTITPNVSSTPSLPKEIFVSGIYRDVSLLYDYKFITENGSELVSPNDEIPILLRDKPNDDYLSAEPLIKYISKQIYNYDEDNKLFSWGSIYNNKLEFTANKNAQYCTIIYTVDDKTIELENNKALFYNGGLFLPVSSIDKILGLSLIIDENSKTATIYLN